MYKSLLYKIYITWLLCAYCVKVSLTMLFFPMLYYRRGDGPAGLLAVFWGVLTVTALKWLFYDVQTLFFKLSMAPKLFSASQATQLCWFLIEIWWVYDTTCTQGSAILLDNTSRNEDLRFRSVLNLLLIVPAKIVNCIWDM